ncbi:MAG: TonB-dependent receptor [Bacteroidales bacterium]|nr:TonB-dependent receptor [Bacteroidales bacterium]
MRKLFVTILLLLNLSVIYSQKAQISGYVSDNKTGERLIGAVVTDKTNNKAVSTNGFGFFSIDCPENTEIILQCSFIGYLPIEKSFKTEKNLTYNFDLESGIAIKEVIISTNKQILNNSEMGTTTLPVSQVKLMPALGGESDILKAIQMMPGVQGGTEGSSGLYVRGGGIDQNLILLDDVPLYYVNHLGGFVSTFNTDAINDVKLIKGSFPARYGGRLSSVLDVRMKDGNMKKISGNYTISLVASKFLIEGPIKKDTSSFLISTRGLLWGFAYAGFSKLVFEDFMINYNFYDVNAKFNRILNEKNRIYFSFYYGDDNFVPRVFTEDKNEKIIFPTRWGNFLSSVRWNKTFNSKLFSNTTLSYTRYRYKNSLQYSDKQTKSSFEQTYLTGINDLSAKFEIQYFANNYLNFRVGADWTYHEFNPGFFHYISTEKDTLITDTTYGNKKIYSQEANFFIENSLKIGNHINLNIGGRFSNYLVDKKLFMAFEPRILANYKVNTKTSVKASFTQSHQNIHLLTSSTVGMPVDLWVPATSIAKPELSTQYSIGFYQILKKDLILSIEGYYKTMNNLISFSEGLSYYGAAQNWEQKIETEGIGTSYGLEILAEKKSGKLTGWISYTYANTSRQFENINNGKAYPFKYDRRHSLNIVTNYKINEKISLSASWVYGSGYPFTMAIGKYPYLNEENNNSFFYRDFYNIAYIYPDRNSFRMRAFHHLDIGANFEKEKKNGVRTWTISVYNVYNRQNPFYYYMDTDQQGNWHLYQQSMFPIIPSISYSFKF